MASKYLQQLLEQQKISATYAVSEDKVEIITDSQITDKQLDNIVQRYDINPHIDAILAKEGWDYKKLTPSSGKTQSVTESPVLLMLTKLTKENMKDKMGTGGRLHNRSGRFRNSVNVSKITDKDIYYTYQLSPYSVFDPEVSTYHGLSLKPFRGARDPKRLISEALQAAAKELMHKRFNIKYGY